jgi:hypothetical protein
VNHIRKKKVVKAFLQNDVVFMDKIGKKKRRGLPAAGQI